MADAVSSNNASLTYILPMNTTDIILAKTGDTREGLLGMANDSENYGDLYVVDGDGKARLTKGGVKTEVIWEGSATEFTEYVMTKDIDNFKFIGIVCSNQAITIPVVYNGTYNDDDAMTHLFSVYCDTSTSVYYNVMFYNNIFNFVYGTQSGTDLPMEITKIIGIY